MTEVLFAGERGGDLRADLLAYENARRALSAYDLREPYPNTVVVDTVSLGAAVSLCNDLDWYLTRVARTTLVREPSVDDEEWLSRTLAEAVRDGRVDPDHTGGMVHLYDVAEDGLGDWRSATRNDPETPASDVWDLEDTVVVRVTEAEFRDA